MPWEITIDASGRLVIPKEVRLRHHLSAGQRLELSEEEDRLVLIPRHRQTATKEKAGLVVFRGRLPERFPDHRVLRDERLDGLAGDR